MKPSWDEAPEWANWLAMDEDGSWYWYEYEPMSYVMGYFYSKNGGRHITARRPNPTWEESLERRP